ncbi:ribosome hibernation-promoting factor, HPF/YfiA family [Longibacter salinarum]|nr:ribosome-associated translation inhibitor RaiA [Longibacter salinarum]
MNTQITVRHVDVTDHVKEYAEKRAEKLERFYDGIVSTHIILGEDNSPAQDKQVEINIDVYQKRLTAENSASTYEQAINSCVDQLRRQLEKYKSQLRSKKRDAH